MLVHAGKYRTEGKLKTQTICLHKLNATLKKQQQECKTEQNKTTLVQLPLTTLGKVKRWAYSTTRAYLRCVPQYI